MAHSGDPGWTAADSIGHQPLDIAERGRTGHAATNLAPRQGLAQLSPHERDVIGRSFFGERTPLQIAERYGVSCGRTSSR